MLKNYLTTAWRNIIRHKSYSFINITGLSVGIAACLLLFLVISYERSYDVFQPNYKRICHVVTSNKFSDGITYNGGVPAPALDAMRVALPDLVFAGMDASFGSQVTVGDKKFIEETGFFFGEPQFFTLFHYDWLSGNPTVLKGPNQVVLTKKIAEKYFGAGNDPIGKLIKIDNLITATVAGVIDNPRANTDFPLGVIISFATLRNNGKPYNYNSANWNGVSSNFQVFALMPTGTDIVSVNKRLSQFSESRYSSKNPGSSIQTNFAVPLSEVHFDKRFDSFGDHYASRSTLWTLTLIAFFIIGMACINYINLATALAVGRSKEVGIRKVLGGMRGQLFFQVMGETALVVFFATVAAIALAFVCLPFVGQIASIPASLQLFNWQTVLFLIAVVLLVVILAGLYPSLVLSRFTPILALKNKISAAKIGGISLRRGLVVTQFVISQVLIIGTIVAVSQMNFIHTADLGFDKDAVLLLSANADSSFTARESAFKAKLLADHSVRSVSFATDAPSSDNNWSSNFAFNHQPDEKYQVALKFGDEDYLKTFGLQLLAGNSYSKSDTMKDVLINETLAGKLGLKNPRDAVGKDIRVGGGQWKTIVGVMKDFKTNSLRENIRPMVIAESKSLYSVTAVKLKSSNLAATQAAIQASWDEVYPEYAYAGRFLDENIDRFYQQENQLSLLYKIFAGLALLISSLGLYGLVSFMAVQKTKEVGVRKVLGASVGNIVYLFSKEFTLLIVIAFAMAAPVAYWMMHHWLQDFVYRIQLGLGVFILAMAISIVIAWATVAYRAVKAALANPIKSLRSE